MLKAWPPACGGSVGMRAWPPTRGDLWACQPQEDLKMKALSGANSCLLDTNQHLLRPSCFYAMKLSDKDGWRHLMNHQQCSGTCMAAQTGSFKCRPKYR